MGEAKKHSDAAYAYCLLRVAERLVDVAIDRIRLHSESAFAFALVGLELAVLDPAFNDLFLANFHINCPYTVPRYLKRNQYASLPDYMRACGYTEKKDGPHGFEEESSYFEKMAGLIALFAAYTQIPYDRHPHGPAQGWVWLARLLNQEPKTATGTVLITFLETAGYQLSQQYPRQMQKVFDFIQKDFFPRLDISTPPRKASAARLQLFLEAYHKAGRRLTEPRGRHLPQRAAGDQGFQRIEQGDYGAGY